MKIRRKIECYPIKLNKTLSTITFSAAMDTNFNFSQYEIHFSITFYNPVFFSIGKYLRTSTDVSK
jgi:hypothetical protein